MKALLNSAVGLLIVAALAAFLAVPATPALAGGGDEPCAGDVNGDGQVNIGDLIVVFMNYGCTEKCEGDANNDGAVDVFDIVEIILNFGPCDGEGCDSNEACDDGDPCTFDICLGGTCLNIPLPGPDCGGDGG